MVFTETTKDGLLNGQKHSSSSPSHLRVSPIYEENLEGAASHLQMTKPSAQVNRYSVISTTSSTTSGIVSDKTCFSFYGSNGKLPTIIHLTECSHFK